MTRRDLETSGAASSDIANKNGYICQGKLSAPYYKRENLTIELDRAQPR